MARRSVLVVEDEPLLLMHIADELMEAGFDVIESPNADDALRRIASNPDIGMLFTDVDMPGSIDGLVLCRIVRERWPDMVVMVTSGKLSLERTPLPPGALFIPKPYDASALVHAVRMVLGE